MTTGSFLFYLGAGLVPGVLAAAMAVRQGGSTGLIDLGPRIVNMSAAAVGLTLGVGAWLERPGRLVAAEFIGFVVAYVLLVAVSRQPDARALRPLHVLASVALLVVEVAVLLV